MSDANGTLSVDQTTRLLRLYLSWPERLDEIEDAEAQSFYNWLVAKLDDLSLAETTGGLEGVKQFIIAHLDVIHAAWHSRPVSSDNERKEQRIPTSTQVFVVIYDCASDPSLEGASLLGIMMDMGRNGMHLESNVEIPAGSIVNLTVVHTGSPDTLYHLTGEVRWLSYSAETKHMGIMIFNFEDYQRWYTDYSLTFGRG